MRAVWFILKLGLKILAAPVVLALALFTWVCFGLLYVSSFIFGLASTVVALLGIAVLATYSPQNGIILLVIAFLVSPVGLPMAAAWLLGKVQDLRYMIQDAVYG
ncbi:CD1845 family protein [bacterium]|nr:CD1845 family protein [bacterium]MCI7193416.1 CD1845 family protein [bacterium]